MNEPTTLRAGIPSAEAFRTQIGRLWTLWLGAMFLKPEAYTYARDQKNPFGRGLVYITIIGVVSALAGILGTALRYATSPTLEGIKNTILAHLQAMPFYNTFNPAAQDAFTQGFNRTWDQLGALFVGYPTDAAGFVTLGLTIVTTPLLLLVGWIVYGAFVHLVGRGWNRETSFGELLAPLALATSPYLLHVLHLLPSGDVSGLTLALWTFICNIFAIRIAYQTTTRRAVWGALFPILVLAIVLLLVTVGAFAVLTPVIRSLGGAQ